MSELVRQNFVEKWSSMLCAKDDLKVVHADMRMTQKRVDRLVKKAVWRSVDTQKEVYTRVQLRDLAREGRRKGATIARAQEALDKLVESYETLDRFQQYYQTARARYYHAAPARYVPRTYQQLHADRAARAKKTLCDAVRACLLYTSPSPRDRQKSRMPSSA